MLIVDGLGQVHNVNAAMVAAEPGVALDAVHVDARAISDSLAAGLSAVNVTVGYFAGAADPYAATLRDLDAWDAVCARWSRELLPVRSAADIERAHREGRLGILYGFQNGAMIGAALERIDEFRKRGVRIVQLTYNTANDYGGGSLSRPEVGLTRLGHAAVERLQDRRLAVDLSHSSRQTCLDVAATARRPVSINHTGCRALADLPRNKDDDEMRAVAETGGVVGIYFMYFLTATGAAYAADVVRHLEHAVTVCGEDHVCIGSDGAATTFDDWQQYLACFEREHLARLESGAAALGEGIDRYPFAMDLRGPTQFRRLIALLGKSGWGDDRIEKVMGLNLVRFLREVWGG